jgi:hypothetical protein
MASDTQYQIVVVPNFFDPDIQGNNRPTFLCRDGRRGDEELLFDSIADAKDLIMELEDGTYCLANGEAGRPEYYIVEAGYDISHGDQGNYDWSDNDCTNGDDETCCGECSECIEMMIDQDRERVIANAVAGPDFDIEEA